MLIISIIYSFNFYCFHGIVPGLGTKQKAKYLITQYLAFSYFTIAPKLFPIGLSTELEYFIINNKLKNCKMEKVEKFKKLCQDLQKRKLDLDKEVNNYVNIATNLNKFGIYVIHDGIVDINSKLNDETKQEIEEYLHEIEDKVKNETEWIKERRQAYCDAFTEIERLLEKYLPQQFSNYAINEIKSIAMYNDLLAITRGESIINDIEASLSK